MWLFTLFPNLITKESYNWRITRRFWGFRQQISKAKYLKISQNIGGKYQEASGEHRSTVQNGCSPIRVGGYQMIRIRPSGEVETPISPIRPLNSGREHPGRKVRSSRMQWRQPGANGNAHLGANGGAPPGATPIWISGPDALRWCWFMPNWCLSWFVSSWCSLIEGVINKIYNL